MDFLNKESLLNFSRKKFHCDFHSGVREAVRLAMFTVFTAGRLIFTAGWPARPANRPARRAASQSQPASQPGTSGQPPKTRKSKGAAPPAPPCSPPRGGGCSLGRDSGGAGLQEVRCANKGMFADAVVSENPQARRYKNKSVRLNGL